MADILMTGAGGGGVTSDDVTATKKQVVAGYTTVTIDSDDEVVEGTLPNKGNGGVHTPAREFWYHPPVNGYVLRFDEGAYYQDGQYKPWVHIPTSLAKQAVGYNPDHTLETAYVCNEKGRIRVIDTARDGYTYNRATNFGVNTSGKHFWVDIPHGNAYYMRHDNIPHVMFDSRRLGNAPNSAILQGYSATSEHGLAVQGTIGRWVCNTGDVHTCWNNEAHVWDDTYAGRGRGVIARIPSGHFIENANWVFVPTPGLDPSNIREGTRVLNITGAMKDYGAGRAAFNNATFDGTLISGVAERIAGLYRSTAPHESPIEYYGGRVRRSGDKGYPMYMGNLTWDIWLQRDNSLMLNRTPGVWANHSINLSPFSRVRIEIEFAPKLHPLDNWYMQFRFIPTSAVFDNGVSHTLQIDEVTGEHQPIHKKFLAGDWSGISLSKKLIKYVRYGERVVDIDVSDIQGQFYFFMGCVPDKRGGSGGRINNACRVTKIEFIN